MKVLSETYGEHSLTLQLSAPGGSRQTLQVRENAAQKKLASADAELSASEQGLRSLTIRFPEAAGYTGKAVTLTW